MVDRCVCKEVPFSRVAELAREGLGFEQIKARTGCCTGCGMCEPYVHRVIESGAVRLPVMSIAESEAIMRKAREYLKGTKEH